MHLRQKSSRALVLANLEVVPSNSLNKDRNQRRGLFKVNLQTVGVKGINSQIAVPLTLHDRLSLHLHRQYPHPCPNLSIPLPLTTSNPESTLILVFPPQCVPLLSGDNVSAFLNIFKASMTFYIVLSPIFLF